MRSLLIFSKSSSSPITQTALFHKKGEPNSKSMKKFPTFLSTIWANKAKSQKLDNDLDGKSFSSHQDTQKHLKDQNFQEYSKNQRNQEKPSFQSLWDSTVGKNENGKGNFGQIQTLEQTETYSWDCGKNTKTVTCSLTPSGQFSISGSGEMKDYSLTSFGDWYENRTSIISITTNETVSTIGAYAFYDCDNLVTINFGPSLTTLSESCFQNCDGLTTLFLGLDITSIGSYAFANCTTLANVTYCGRDDPGSSSDDVFSNCHESLTVYISPRYHLSTFCKYTNLANTTSCPVIEPSPTFSDNIVYDAPYETLLFIVVMFGHFYIGF